MGGLRRLGSLAGALIALALVLSSSGVPAVSGPGGAHSFPASGAFGRAPEAPARPPASVRGSGPFGRDPVPLPPTTTALRAPVAIGSVGRSATWIPLTPSPSPSARVGSAMGFDPRLNETILFGGHLPPPYGADGNDTWSFYDGHWSNLTSGLTVSPPARSGAGFAYDPQDGYLVMFGGSPSSGAYFNDTWTYSASGWRELSTVSAPSARTWSAMSWDSTDHEVVLFGGTTASGAYLDDTWTFVHGAWTNVTGGFAPLARAYAGMADDPSRGGAVLNGGRTDTASLPFNDTDLFAAGAWRQVAASLPPGRADPGMEYDPAAGGVLLFGGFNGSTGNVYYNDTWMLGASGWSELSPPSAPIPRGAAGMSLNGPNGAPILFGGAGALEDLGDFWTYDAVVANASAPSVQGIVPFDFRATADPGGGWAPYNVSWQLGDGSSAQGANVEHTFRTTGSFEVNVTANDSFDVVGLPQNFAVTVVLPPALSVTISTNISSGPVPLSVAFGASITGGVAPYTYAWTFGDGSSSTLSAPDHSYSAAGAYAPDLRVTDSDGQQANASTRIHASPAPCCAGGPGGAASWVQAHAALLALTGGAAAVVLLLAAIGLRRRRSGSTDPLPTSDPPAPPAADPSDEDSPVDPGPSDAPLFPATDPEAVPVVRSDAGPPTRPPDEPPIATGAPTDLPVSSRPLSDQILVRLYRLGRPDPEGLAAAGFTQEGLAAALGRPQSAFARSLLRLEEAGLIAVQTSHVQGGRRRRKVYQLTPAAESAARRCMEPLPE